MANSLHHFAILTYMKGFLNNQDEPRTKYLKVNSFVISNILDGWQKKGTGKERPATNSPEPRSSAQSGDSSARKDNGPTQWLSGVIRKNSLSIIIILFSLFFIITFSNPALFINDE